MLIIDKAGIAARIPFTHEFGVDNLNSLTAGSLAAFVTTGAGAAVNQSQTAVTFPKAGGIIKCCSLRFALTALAVDTTFSLYLDGVIQPSTTITVLAGAFGSDLFPNLVIPVAATFPHLVSVQYTASANPLATICRPRYVVTGYVNG